VSVQVAARLPFADVRDLVTDACVAAHNAVRARLATRRREVEELAKAADLDSGPGSAQDPRA
jgi:hypothetical protein